MRHGQDLNSPTDDVPAEHALWREACDLLEQHGNGAIDVIDARLRALANEGRSDAMKRWFDLAEIVFRLEANSPRIRGLH